jgi:hypothetical protein
MSSYESNKSYVLAAMLDPRFNLRWCTDGSDKVRYQLLKLEASNTLNIVTSYQCNDQSESTTSDNPTIGPPSKKAKTLHDFMVEPGLPETHHRQSCGNDIKNTCLHHVNQLVLTQQPTGKRTSWSCVLSSCAPVERLFSIVGKVFIPSRCRLNDSRFEQLMFIRCNNSVINC